MLIKTYIIFILLLFSINIFGQQCQIIKPTSKSSCNYSGDLQSQSINEKLNNPIRVKVLLNDTTPLKNQEVTFRFSNFPENAKGQKIYDKVCYTDTEGIASTYVKLGDKKGVYEIIGKTKSKTDSFETVYNITAKKSNWVFLLIIGLLGGLGLFLFGMNVLSEGLQRSAGSRMRTILSKLTQNRLIGVALGTFVTMIIQSSSATTVMLVSFVESRLMRFSQTIPVILGAAIGTTITAQLIAFKLTDYSLLLIALGFSLKYFTKTESLKNIGQTVFGFGILFFGMYIMSEAMYPLRTYQPFIDLLLHLENPLVSIIIGMLFTALIQSSSAFIGIMIILGSQGFLSIEASIPLVLGSNVGTAITALLASIKTGRDAKKVAITHTLYKIVGVLIFVWWIPQLVEIIETISPKPTEGANQMAQYADTVPRQIANVHTIFNVVIALIFIPLTRLTARLIHRILPTKLPAKKEFKLKFINKSIIHTPTLALSLAKQEVIRMGGLVQDMLNDILLPFFTNEPNVLKEIAEKEKNINYLRDEIKQFLIDIGKSDIQETQVNESFQILYTIKEFEQIADLISLNLNRKAKSWVDADKSFSEEGKKEIMEYHLKTQKQISRAVEVFRDMNLERAKVMKLKYKKYRGIAQEFERSHYERLIIDMPMSKSSSKTHLELISIFREISSHATNIARIMIEWQQDK